MWCHVLNLEINSYYYYKKIIFHSIWRSQLVCCLQPGELLLSGRVGLTAKPVGDITNPSSQLSLWGLGSWWSFCSVVLTSSLLGPMCSFYKTDFKSRVPTVHCQVHKKNQTHVELVTLSSWLNSIVSKMSLKVINLIRKKSE